MIHKENSPEPENKSSSPSYNCTKTKLFGMSHRGADQVEYQLCQQGACSSSLDPKGQKPGHDGYMEEPSPSHLDQCCFRTWRPGLHELYTTGLQQCAKSFLSPPAVLWEESLKRCNIYQRKETRRQYNVRPCQSMFSRDQ